jgi:glycosyltransferase involved in cell wall biosynthesis
MKICHVVPASPERITGPRNSVTLLSRGLNNIKGVESLVFSPIIRDEFLFNYESIYPLERLFCGRPDVVVFSGIYGGHFSSAARRLRLLSVPYVISPRSSLMRAGMSKSPIKKAIYLASLGASYIYRAEALHFLTEEEATNSLTFGRRFFVNSNGVNCSLNDVDWRSKKKVITFIGRLDVRHKGLDIFVRGVMGAATTLRDQGWCVKIRGPDFENGDKLINELVRRNKLSDVVEIGGEIVGDEKRALLEETSIFVHTSRYEGQPQAVMESMAHGCAIVVTPGTNMSGPAEVGGWEVGLKPGSVANALVQAVCNEDCRVEKMKRSYEFACRNYSWTKLAFDFHRELMGVIR